MERKLSIEAGVYGAELFSRHARLKAALQKIANLKESNSEKYIAKCDEIALDALIEDHAEDVDDDGTSDETCDPKDVCAECNEPLNGSGTIWCDRCKNFPSDHQIDNEDMHK